MSTPLTFPYYVTASLFSNANQFTRYEIEGDAPAWQDAEKQVQNATRDGRGTVVSVKTGKQKRKEGPTAADVYEEVLGDKSSRKKKKSKKA